jgi:ERCC4-type nuclease
MFDVQMARLDAGDYLVEGGVLVERKTYADFAASVADGRLFPQAARLARSPHRPVVLIEGLPTASMPDVHPNALKGASISLAVMWRLPVLHSSDPQDSLQILRCLANQASRSTQNVLRRYDCKPKRLASRRLYVLQGLPGVGPALAYRLLLQLGSVERVVTADEATLMQVRGLGAKKASRIRELVS